MAPASRRMDYTTKLFKYRTAGVREYWIVDAEKNRVTAYTFGTEENMNEYSFTDYAPVFIYPEFSINLSKLDI